MSVEKDHRIQLQEATVRYGERTILDRLDLTIEPGDFVAVLGPNGAGKTTLVKVLLGLIELVSGRVTVGGVPPARGDSRIGYVPQQRGFDANLPIRGRDLVRFGLDGHRPGLRRSSRALHAEVDAAIAAVGAAAYANAPIGSLSGGEQQRLRIAQALVARPSILLCDEPLLSLDLAHQRNVTRLMDGLRRERGASVVFVTHEINPVLPYVDHVVYLVDGRWAVGSADEVLTSERLSDLYGTQVDVLRLHQRIVVLGAGDEGHCAHEHEREFGALERGR